MRKRGKRNGLTLLSVNTVSRTRDGANWWRVLSSITHSALSYILSHSLAHSSAATMLFMFTSQSMVRREHIYLRLTIQTGGRTHQKCEAPAHPDVAVAYIPSVFLGVIMPSNSLFVHFACTQKHLQRTRRLQPGGWPSDSRGQSRPPPAHLPAKVGPRTFCVDGESASDKCTICAALRQKSVPQ